MPRDYKKEYEYHGTPEQIENRSSRNKARRQMEAKHGKDAIKGKDVDHVDGNPKRNDLSNLRITSKSKNRSKK